MTTKFRDSALVLGSILLALGAAELVARAVFPPLPNVEIREDPEAVARRSTEIAEGRTFDAPGSEISGLYVYTPTGLRLRANTVARVVQHNVSGRTVEIRTNSLGYRNPEIGAKQEGRPRVLFLGDSVTNAGYIDESETFVRMVETLSAQGGGPVYETINAAVGGVGLEDELAILNETGLGTNPDVVVLCFYLNDPVPSPGVWLVPPPTWLERSRLAAYALMAVEQLRGRAKTDASAEQMADLDGWLEQVRRDFPPGGGDPLTDRAAFNAAIEKNFRDWGCSWSDGAWERMTPVFRELDRLAGIHHFDLRIVCFPLRAQVEAAVRRRRAAAASRAHRGRSCMCRSSICSPCCAKRTAKLRPARLSSTITATRPRLATSSSRGRFSGSCERSRREREEARRRWRELQDSRQTFAGEEDSRGTSGRVPLHLGRRLLDVGVPRP